MNNNKKISGELFSEPSDRRFLWHYMDFVKFVSILTKGTIFFARSDMFPDPNEGLYTQKNIDTVKKDVAGNQSNNWIHRLKLARENIFINCWHMSNKESAAFWKIYSAENKGIAIKTTFGKIKKAIDDKYIKDNWITEPIYTKVKYINREDTEIEEDNILKPYIRKDKCFKYENEFRIIIWAAMIDRPATFLFKDKLFKYCEEIDKICKPKLDANDYREFIRVMNSMISLYRVPQKNGIEVPFDINSLIQKIYVSPKAEDWFRDFIKFILNYLNYPSLAKNVEKSKMYEATY